MLHECSAKMGSVFAVQSTKHKILYQSADLEAIKIN